MPSGSRVSVVLSSEFGGRSGMGPGSRPCDLHPLRSEAPGQGAACAILARVSESNLEVVRRMFAAFADRDLGAMLPELDPDVVFLPVTANLTTGGVPYRGHDGMAQYLADVAGVWPELRLFPEDMRELGDVVVVLGRVLARGGGMILDRPTGWLFTLRDRKIVRGDVYGSHEEALAAARGR
jgi:ketosteroid isomerase-like protein